ncbi:unnamed protein product, partial [Ectocarpus sp. 4 AP-2014]
NKLDSHLICVGELSNHSTAVKRGGMRCEPAWTDKLVWISRPLGVLSTLSHLECRLIATNQGRDRDAIRIAASLENKSSLLHAIAAAERFEEIFERINSSTAEQLVATRHRGSSNMR